MLELVERGFFKSRLKLKEGPSSPLPDVQVLRVGSFNHPKYGEFKITKQVLSEMKANFENNVRGIDIAFDYYHESDKAASGWLEELYLSEDESELWAKVDWTPNAARMLTERELRYFSPDFAFQWEDPETSVTYNNVLFGGGLTNRPFVKDMAAIVAAEKEKEQMKLEEMEKKILKLSDDMGGLQKAHDEMKAENEGLKKKLAEYGEKNKEEDGTNAQGGNDSEDNSPTVESLQKELADMKACNEKLMAEKKKSEEAKQMAEKEATFIKLMNEGKACAAQKDAFIKGDMNEFVKLSEPVNLSGKGAIVKDSDIDQTQAEKDEKILKLAEEKCKADKNLKLVDAISIAQREVK